MEEAVFALTLIGERALERQGEHVQRCGSLKVQDMLGNFIETEEANRRQNYDCASAGCFAQSPGLLFMLQPP